MIVIGKPRISNGVLYLDEAEFASREAINDFYSKELRNMPDFYDPEAHNIRVVFDNIEEEERTFVLVKDKKTEFPLSQQEIDWIQV